MAHNALAVLSVAQQFGMACRYEARNVSKRLVGVRYLPQISLLAVLTEVLRTERAERNVVSVTPPPGPVVGYGVRERCAHSRTVQLHHVNTLKGTAFLPGIRGGQARILSMAGTM